MHFKVKRIPLKNRFERNVVISREQREITSTLAGKRANDVDDRMRYIF